MNNKVKGYLLGAVAAASYGTNPLFALPLYAKSRLGIVFPLSFCTSYIGIHA